jgi:hypothetical protein
MTIIAIAKRVAIQSGSLHKPGFLESESKMSRGEVRHELYMIGFGKF